MSRPLLFRSSRARLCGRTVLYNHAREFPHPTAVCFPFSGTQGVGIFWGDLYFSALTRRHIGTARMRDTSPAAISTGPHRLLAASTARLKPGHYTNRNWKVASAPANITVRHNSTDKSPSHAGSETRIHIRRMDPRTACPGKARASESIPCVRRSVRWPQARASAP